ncbi:MAG: sialate O-acetylesterase [Planctomycetales bacterium]|nr:sialate O-acetylesterase [Planctomycetales bacterium]
MKRRWKFCGLALVLVAACAATAAAEVKLPAIFGDSMVLQQGIAAPVWGTAAPGEKITVTFAGQTKTATADDQGKWQVKLDALQANKEGQALSVAGANTVELKDVLIGEVWICSGQSNMEWPVNATLNADAEKKNADNAQIRLFNVPGHTVAPSPQTEGAGQWQVCNEQNVGGFSAVGYFFGRRLQKDLDVPVGLVGSNWGGTRIEPWCSLEGLESVPELADIAAGVKERAEKSKTEKVDVQGGTPSAIFNSMVNPLAPFAMRGGVWYQGESNGGEGESYYHKKKALVNGWRKLFNPDLAFYWVQLANFQKPNDNPEGGDGWAKLREAQVKALSIPGTGMATIIDIGEANDIHPRNKQDVGDRLARWALHQTYGKSEIVPSGPIYKSIKVEGSAIRVSFDHVGGGLMVGQKSGLEPTQELKDGKLARFAIAGEDKKWQWAEAKIDGDSVVVSSAEVKNPVAVRYAFSMNPVGANLYNKEGLPASPFRSDDW